jgi:hypothetical protein
MKHKPLKTKEETKLSNNNNTNPKKHTQYLLEQQKSQKSMCDYFKFLTLGFCFSISQLLSQIRDIERTQN